MVCGSIRGARTMQQDSDRMCGAVLHRGDAVVARFKRQWLAAFSTACLRLILPLMHSCLAPVRGATAASLLAPARLRRTFHSGCSCHVAFRRLAEHTVVVSAMFADASGEAQLPVCWRVQAGVFLAATFSRQQGGSGQCEYVPRRGAAVVLGVGERARAAWPTAIRTEPLCAPRIRLLC